MALDDFRADEQAEAAAPDVAGASRAITAVEHPLALPVGNSNAVIANRHDRDAAVDAYLYVDVTTIGRVLDRVANHVLKNSLYAVLIELGHDGRGGRRVAKRMDRRQHLHLIHRGLNGRPQVRLPEIEFDLVRVNRAQIRQRIDQVRRLQRGGVNPAEQTRDVASGLPRRESMPRRPDDHRERISHVV
jgi:hypothetical protein